MKISGECANLDIDTGSAFTPSGLTLDITYLIDVDLRQVLGTMYHKYEKFMIIFNGVGGWTSASSWSSSTNVAGINATGSWSLGMSGLNWAFNTYNGSITDVAFFPNKITLPISGYGTTNVPNYRNGIVFRKPSNSVVSLKIVPYLTRSNGTAIAVVTTGSPTVDFNYSFSIYGLTDED